MFTSHEMLLTRVCQGTVVIYPPAYALDSCYFLSGMCMSFFLMFTFFIIVLL